MGNVRVACEAAGIDRQTLYRERAGNARFARAWEDALADAVDLLEASAWVRATKGVPRPIWLKDGDGNPVKVGELVEYSDRMTELLLKAHRPEKYGRQAIELSGPGGSALAPSVTCPTQVIIQIPDNGRGLPPSINVESGQKALAAPQSAESDSKR